MMRGVVATPYDWRKAEEIVRDRLNPPSSGYNLRVYLAVSAIIYVAMQKKALIYDLPHQS